MDNFFVNVVFLNFSIILGYVFSIFWVRHTQTLRKILNKSGLHFHHTLFIIPSVMLWFLTSGAFSFSVLGFGIGTVIHDFLVHGSLKFITKD